MKRYGMVLIASLFFIIFLFSLSPAQGPKEIKPVQPDVKKEPIGLPPLPDLIIVAGLRLDRPPFIAFSALAREEAIIVPIRFRIENRGNADAGRFRISVMQQLASPPGAETEAMVEGDRSIGGLRPTRLHPREGVGFYNLLWNVVFPKSMAGKTVKIRAIIDSNNEVRESDERDNVTRWLAVQLPPLEIRRPPAKVTPKGGK
jgi:hypothetical protein